MPKGFDFGSYAGYQLHTYVASVGEISVPSWMGLAVVVVLNYIRTLVDTTAETYECSNQPVDQLWGCGGECTGVTEAAGNSTATTVHRHLSDLSSSLFLHTWQYRQLSGGGGENAYVSPDEHCYLFFFTYAFFCAFVLNLLIYGIYYTACYYEHVMVAMSVKVSFPDIYDEFCLKDKRWCGWSTSFANQHEVYVRILHRLKAHKLEKEQKALQELMT